MLIPYKKGNSVFSRDNLLFLFTKNLLILSLITVFSICAFGQDSNQKPDIFELPAGRAAEAYEIDLESMLRSKYQLKIETGAGTSILQWSLSGGELPFGLSIRTNGVISGMPTIAQTSQIRVRVIDAARSGEPLTIDFKIVITAPRLRLAKITSLVLMPVEKPSTNFDSEKKTVAEQPAISPVALNMPGNTLNTFAPSDTSMNSTMHSEIDSNKIPNVTEVEQNGVKISSVDEKRDDPNDDCDSRSTKVISDEVFSRMEGDTRNFPTCVQFTNLNTLKYRVEFGQRRTRDNGPDITSLPFIPKLTPTTPESIPSAVTPIATKNSPSVQGFKAARGIKDKDVDAAVTDVNDDILGVTNNFNDILGKLSRVERYLINAETNANNAITGLEDANRTTVRLANTADEYFLNKNILKLLTEVDTLKDSIDSALGATYPETGTILRDIKEITDLVANIRVYNNKLASLEAWTAWLEVNQQRYDRVKERLTELKAKTDAVNTAKAGFLTGRENMKKWQYIVNNIKDKGANAFQRKVTVTCHNDEDEKTSSALTISKTDRTVDSPTTVSRDVVTVECYSRVTLTGGINFSSLNEEEFAIVQSASPDGTVVKKFGFTKRSSFRPNPIVLFNMRLTNNPIYNFHATFGAIVDLQGQSGTDIEPVAGVSFSIRRLMFITPIAVHFGRVNKLAGGFKTGDTVPEAVTTPPLEKSWRVGYTSAVTFRIK